MDTCCGFEVGVCCNEACGWDGDGCGYDVGCDVGDCALFIEVLCRCCCAYGEGKYDDDDPAAGVGLEAEGELRGAREVEFSIAGWW